MKARLFTTVVLFVVFVLLAFWGIMGIEPSQVNAQGSFDCSPVSEIPETECEALVTFYNSSGGSGWITNTNWLTTNTPCSWYGITCSSGQVQQIVLESNYLSGTLPVEISNLTNLGKLDLSDNQLSGNISAGIGNFSNMWHLDLSQNHFSGTIPDELGNLTNVAWLFLEVNQLSGDIPSSLGNLSNLLQLTLDNNQLTGTIPVELGNLTNLEKLRLHNNQLSGNIPSELGNLVNWLI